MIDHVSVAVRDLTRALATSTKPCSAPLGYANSKRVPATVGFGKNYSEFWINHRPEMTPSRRRIAARMSRCARADRERWMPFTPLRLRMAARRTARRALRPQHGEAAITQPSSAIRTATGSRR